MNFKKFRWGVEHVDPKMPQFLNKKGWGHETKQKKSFVLWKKAPKTLKV